MIALVAARKDGQRNAPGQGRKPKDPATKKVRVVLYLEPDDVAKALETLRLAGIEIRRRKPSLPSSKSEGAVEEG